MTGEPVVTTGHLESLMQRYQQADANAAGELVAELSPQIFRFYLAQVRNRTQAEDLVQEFWLRVHRARKTYRPGEPLLPWIYSIARHVRVDQYRRLKRVQDHEIATEQVPDRPATLEKGTTSIDLNKLLSTLPASQKETILLLKVAGLSLEEAAQATGSSVGAVKQKAHRAYTTLRKLFGGDV
jgi:RNA polymerase sigma-70 factor, ECF subfamily